MLSERSIADAWQGWRRWSVAALAAGAGILLIVVPGLSYLSVRSASEAIVAGQAEELVRAALARLPAERPPTDEEMELVLLALEPEGMEYVAVSWGDRRVEAGHPVLPAVLPELGAVHSMQKAGSKTRVQALIPPPASFLKARFPHQRPPRFLFDPSTEPQPTAPGFPLPTNPGPVNFGPPWLTLDFTPGIAQSLNRRAQAAFGIGIGATVLLGALAAVLYRLLAQRRNLEKRFEEQRHLSQLGEMSAVLAHEIRNPLASLKGNAQLLVETLSSGSRERTKAELVVHEAARLETLTNRLLDFLRSGKIAVERTDLVQVLTQASAAVGAQHFALDFSVARCEWNGDPERLKQALENLLRNAAEVSEQQVQVQLVETRDTILINVADSGPGIPVGQEERIFEPFYTTKVRGTGLGLAIARRIVQLHGGEVHAKTRPEGGAAFSVQLPRGS